MKTSVLLTASILVSFALTAQGQIGPQRPTDGEQDAPPAVEISETTPPPTIWQEVRRKVTGNAFATQIAHEDPDFHHKAAAILNKRLHPDERIKNAAELGEMGKRARRIASGDLTTGESVAQAAQEIMPEVATTIAPWSGPALKLGESYVIAQHSNSPIVRALRDHEGFEAETKARFVDEIQASREFRELAAQVFPEYRQQIDVMGRAADDPIFRGDAFDREVLALLPEPFTRHFGEIIKNNNPTMGEIRSAISDSEKQILRDVASQFSESLKEETTAPKKTLDLDYEFDLAAGFASGLVVVDPQISRVAKGVFVQGKAVAGHLDSVLDAMKAGKAMKALSGMGNIVGAIGSLVSMIGPSSDQLIMEQLVAIRKQLDALKRDIECHFAVVNSKLDELTRLTNQLIEELREFNTGIFQMSDQLRTQLADLEATLVVIAPEVINAMLAQADAELKTSFARLTVADEVIRFCDHDLHYYSDVRNSYPFSVPTGQLRGFNLWASPAATNHAFASIPEFHRPRVSRDWRHWAQWTTRLCAWNGEDSNKLLPLLESRLSELDEFTTEYNNARMAIPWLTESYKHSRSAIAQDYDKIVREFAAGRGGELQRGRIPGVLGISQLLYANSVDDVVLTPEQEAVVSQMLSSDRYVKQSHGPPRGSNTDVFFPLPEHVKKNLHVSTKLGLLFGWIRLRTEYITDPKRPIEWNDMANTLDAQFEVEILPVEGKAPKSLKAHFLFRAQYGLPKASIEMPSPYPGPAFHNNWSQFVTGWFGENADHLIPPKSHSPNLVAAIEELMREKQSAFKNKLTVEFGPNDDLIEGMNRSRDLLIAAVSATSSDASALATSLPTAERMREDLLSLQPFQAEESTAEVLEELDKVGAIILPPEIIAAEATILLRLEQLRATK